MSALAAGVRIRRHRLERPTRASAEYLGHVTESAALGAFYLLVSSVALRLACVRAASQQAAGLFFAASSSCSPKTD